MHTLLLPGDREDVQYMKSPSHTHISFVTPNPEQHEGFRVCGLTLGCCGCSAPSHSVGDLGWSSELKQQHSHISFQGSSSFSLSSNPLETEALGQACFILMDRNDAHNDSPSVNSTSAAMQGMDILLLVVNSQQIPVCSFSLVQRIQKSDRNQINVISSCSCG